MPARAGHLSGSVGVFGTTGEVDAWAEPLRRDGAQLRAPIDSVDHLLLIYPSLGEALQVAQGRAERRGTTWVVVEPSMDGAAALAVLRAAGVEGQQRVHGVVASRWPDPTAVRRWMESHPRRSEGLGRRALRLQVHEAPAPGGSVQVRGGRSPMGVALAGGSGPDAVVLDAPDAPLASLRAADVDLGAVREALHGDLPVIVGTDDLTQRPGSVPSAVRAAAARVALAPTDRPWLQVGPVGEGPRVLGIAGLDPERVRRQVLAGRGELWLDVDWSDALAGFPHLADVAGHLVEHPVLRRGRAIREVREVAAAVLGRAVPAERPLAELGLDSLLSEELRQRLVEIYGVALPLTLVLEHPTAASLGERVAQETKGPM